MEALIGAIYLDGGFANAKEFIHKFILSDLENKKLFFDSKTILQEIVQADINKPITYQLLKEEGPDHNKAFYVKFLSAMWIMEPEKDVQKKQRSSRLHIRQF